MSSSDSEEPQECPLCRENAPIDLPAYETWLQCDVCEEWYHGVCVGISASECERIDKFHCNRCVDKHGPSSYKGPALRRSGRSHTNVDYTKLNEGQPATFNQYLLRLDAHEFMEDEFEHLSDGLKVTADWIRNRDNNDPFIVNCSEGLGMRMPAQTTSANDIAKTIGEDAKVSVMDVLTQEELSGWTVGDWAKYFHSEDRKRVLNVISLEVSGTPLDDEIQRPRIVDELDLVDKYWPAAKRKPNKYPRIKTYCLMSVSNAYTDFHVDFSATWVYYHVLSGEKTFYLVPPTPSNMRKFESWSKSPDQAVTFFAEQVKQCFEVHLKPGNTMFIPAGWIHAVFTPADTVVIGGNFLVMQSLNTHIGSFKLEARTKVPVRYRFPHFLKLCRYMAEALSKAWGKMEAQEKSKWTVEELEGVFVLASFLCDILGDSEGEAAIAKALGDGVTLRRHADKLSGLVGTELGSRMLPEEWLNREVQLREGIHFRWIRPGMSRGSLLLATRPRRNRSAGTIDATEKPIVKMRLRAAERTVGGTRASKLKLVRGIPQTSTASDASSSGAATGGGAESNAEEIVVALGTGLARNRKLVSKTRNSKYTNHPSAGDDQDTNTAASSGEETDGGASDDDVDDDGSSGDSEAEDEGDEEDCSSSSGDSFIASSDDEDGHKRPRKRKARRVSNSPHAKSPKCNSQVPSKAKGVQRRIAERLKIKI